METCDVLIAGGGMVGATLACALSGQGLRIVLVEPVRNEQRAGPGYDDRAIALAWGTSRIFASLGLWETLSVHATPIHRIHVSERGSPGMVHLDRETEGLPAIGYVVPARALAQVLADAVSRLDDVTLLCPATVTGHRSSGDHAEVQLQDASGERTLQAKLVVAADGAGSLLREQAGIASRRSDYHQVAIVTNITPQLPHDHVAWERFTDTGPLAVLPMSEGRCGVVWTVATEQADHIMALSDAAFLARLQERFGNRLGRLQRVGARQAWPLQLLSAGRSVAARLALVGNAIHTLHPIAGQGFNLGARDVAALAEVLVEAQRAGRDIGAAPVLARYAGWRTRDHRNVTLFTDGLARLFTLNMPGCGLLRGAGMLAFDLLPPAKRLLTRLTMGRSGRTPRLVRGLSL
jgi:2-octaprenyl-6-methoxyphenol hydroxylase